MIILPAIDIKDRNCVRLVKGEFDTVHKVADSYMDTALSFYNSGAEFIHMVDLDGAKDGVITNRDIFVDVAKNTKLKVEIGGGIRTLDTVEYYLSSGIYRVILGSIAVTNPDFVKTAVKEYGDKIAIGIDAKNEMVATRGWLDTSDVHYIDLARAMQDVGVKCIIFTDISKDGTLSGPNLEQLDAINKAVSCDIVASGGIKDIDDIKALTKMGLYGTICGKSLYSGSLDLSESINVARG